MKRYCAKCGTMFEATSAATRYCDACKVEVKKEWAQKQSQLARERALRLGLVNISVYKEEREKLRALAAKAGITTADLLRRLMLNHLTAQPMDAKVVHEAEATPEAKAESSGKKTKKKK